MSQRGKKIKDIDEVAHGRIFLAKQARGLGMVDEIGGIDKAIQYAATQAGLDEKDYEVKVLPGTKTLADILRGGAFGGDAAMPFRPKVNMGETDLMKVVSPSAARLVKQQIQFIQLLQQRPVVLVTPFVVTGSTQRPRAVSSARRCGTCSVPLLSKRGRLPTAARESGHRCRWPRLVRQGASPDG